MEAAPMNLRDRTINIFASAILILISIGDVTWAGSEEDHTVTVSGGIAQPSGATSVFENPAGLAFNSRFRLTAQAMLDSPPTLRGGVLMGNGNVGGTAGITRRTDSSNHSDAFLGMGIQVPALRFTLGVAAFADVNSVSSPSFNIGALIDSGQALTLGVVARSVDNGVGEWGAGLRYKYSGQTYFVLDSTVDSDFGSLALQPGLMLSASPAALTFSYGFGSSQRSSRLHSQQLHEGFSAGASLKLGSTTQCQLYYHHLAELYTAVSFGL